MSSDQLRELSARAERQRTSDVLANIETLRNKLSDAGSGPKPILEGVKAAKHLADLVSTWPEMVALFPVTSGTQQALKTTWLS